jgi:hypothetical protein
VTDQASTYIEFKLKRKDDSDVNQGSSKIQAFYNQLKDFILRRKLPLIIAGICGLYIDLS